MVQEITFEVYGLPIPKGRPRFARRGKFMVAYTDGKTKNAEDDFKLQSLKYKPEFPSQSPLRLHLEFYMVKPKSKPKKITEWTTKPDIDNLQKLVMDSLNGIYWLDDSQIVELSGIKKYGLRNHTLVKISELIN